ncbi:MAG TPA: hypothetical protein VIZ68_05830, partial [Thermoplasmata archaeon]
MAYGTGPGYLAGAPGYALLTDDARDGYPMMVTALNGSGYPGLAAYFRFANGVWSDLPVTYGPGFCANSALQYDATDGTVVYVAADHCPIAGSTWTYQGGTWTNRTTPAHPPARSFAQVADDPSDGYLVLFGGRNVSLGSPAGYLNDTWTYANGTWTNRSSVGVSPSGRFQGAMAYDSTLSEVVLLGGCTVSPSYPCANDTWTYHAGSWSSVPTPGPTLPNYRTGGPRALADDPADLGALAVLSANSSLDNASSSTWFPWLWLFSGSTWSPLNYTGSPSTGSHPMATYASALSSVLLFASPGSALTPPTT